MSGKTAILKVTILGDAKDFKGSMDDAEKSAGGFSAAMDKAAVAAAGVLAGLTAGAVQLIEAGEAASTSNARIEQITESMGLFGDQSAEVSSRLIEVAENQARITGIDPNVLKQGAATLSTFSALAATADQAGGAFDRATGLAADLSAAGFGSVESAATMLGKALQDPIKGLTALGRVGVTFNEQQKAQIEALVAAGDTAAAQAIILDAVEAQVGGVAEATANASDKMKVSWQLVQEELGQKLLPAFEAVSGFVIGALDALIPYADVILIVGGVLGTLAAAVLAVSAAMKVYTAVQTIQTAVQWAQNAAWLANPVTWIILAVVALIAIIVLLWANWDQVWAWILDVTNSVGAAIQAGWQAVTDWFASVFQAIGAWWNDLWSGIVQFFQFQVLAVQLGWQIVTDWFAGIFRSIGAWWDSLWSGAASLVRGIVGGIQDAWASWINWVRSAITNVYNFISGIFQKIGNAISSVVNGVSGAIDTVRGIVGLAAEPLAIEAAGLLTLDAVPAVQLHTLPAIPAVLPALTSLTTAAGPTIRNYTVNVDGALDPYEVARQIKAILKRFDDARGIA